MIVVADASVALKWFLKYRDDEADVEQAMSLLARAANGEVELRQPPHFAVASLLTFILFTCCCVFFCVFRKCFRFQPQELPASWLHMAKSAYHRRSSVCHRRLVSSVCVFHPEYPV